MENNKEVIEFKCSVNDRAHKIAVLYPWGEHKEVENYCVLIHISKSKLFPNR